MGQTFSEYLYYDPQTKDIKESIFTEDCLITGVNTPRNYEHNLETIPEERELLFEEIADNSPPDEHSKDYVKKLFLLARKELDSGIVDKKENFDILYPIRLSNIEDNMAPSHLADFYKLKEKYKTLEWDHEVLKNRYETLKKNYNILNKNYNIVKKTNTKYKFD